MIFNNNATQGITTATAALEYLNKNLPAKCKAVTCSEGISRCKCGQRDVRFYFNRNNKGEVVGDIRIHNDVHAVGRNACSNGAPAQNNYNTQMGHGGWMANNITNPNANNALYNDYGFINLAKLCACCTQ